MSAPRCSHPSGRVRLLASSVLWCSDCGAIARTDGGMLEDAKPKGPPPGLSAWLSPLRQWPQPGGEHPGAALLRELEWSGRSAGERACPSCDEVEPGPHAPDCRLAALLKDGAS